MLSPHYFSRQKTITINVLRDGVTKSLNLVPRQGWGGRGTLGYVSRFTLDLILI